MKWACRDGAPRRAHHDHDVVVVGSGFGGSVAALRLAEKGYDVLVYEAGRRFADDELPRTSWDLRRYVWAPRPGHVRHPADPPAAATCSCSPAPAWAAARSTTPTPSTCRPSRSSATGSGPHITDWRAELAPHYDQASRMLGVVTNPCEGAGRARDARGGRRPRRGGDVPQDPGGRAVRRRRAGSGARGRRPVLRRGRPAPHHLHRVRVVHDRVPGGREEHAGEELPGAGRAARGADRADAHRRRRRAGRPHRGRGRLGRSGLPRHHPSAPGRSAGSRAAP